MCWPGEDAKTDTVRRTHQDRELFFRKIVLQIGNMQFGIVWRSKRIEFICFLGIGRGGLDLKSRRWKGWLLLESWAECDLKLIDMLSVAVQGTC